MENSKKFTLNKQDIIKIFVSALIAGAAATITTLIEVLPHIDFGSNTSYVVAIVSVLLFTIRKFLQGK